MAGKNAVTLEILTEINKSVKSLSELQTKATVNFKKIQSESEKAFAASQKQATESLKKMEKGFDALKAVGVAAIGFIAGSAIINAFDKAVEAASREQDAVNQLNTALQLTGVYSQKTSKDLTEFADKLEETTKFSGEAVLGAQALIQNLGRLSADGLKTATSAAADLSAALGIDLQSAAQLVGKAAQGNVAPLKRYGLAIQEGASASETFASALKQINDRFGGAAAAQVNTFSGATTQLGNAFEEMQKTFGRLIVSNPTIIAGLQTLGKTIREIANAFSKNDKPITGAINSLTTLAVKTIPQLLTPLGFVSTAIGNTIILFNKFASGILTVHRGISILIGGALALLPNVLLKVAEAATIATQATLNFFGQKDAANGLDKALEDIRKKFISFEDINEEFNKSFGGLGSTLGEFQKSLSKTNDGIDEFNEGFVAAIEDARPGIDAAVDGFDGLVKKIGEGAPAVKGVGKAFEDFGEKSEVSIEAIKGSFEKLKTQAESLTTELDKQNKSIQEQIDLEFERQVKLAAAAAEELATQGKLTDAVKEQISNFLKLADAKREAATESSGSALGQAQGAATGALSSLSAGPLGKVSAIVDAIQAIVNFIPQLLEKIANLFDSITDLPNKLVAGVDRLFESAGSFVSNFIPNLFKAIPSIIKSVIKFLGQELPDAFIGLIDMLPELVTELVGFLADELPRLLTKFADNIGPITEKLVITIIDAIPDIVFALVDAFIVKGGLFKLAFALFNLMPQIALGFVQGVGEALKTVGGRIFEEIGRGLGSSFSSSIKLPSFNLGEAKDILSGKKLIDGIKENFGAIKDILTGRRFAEKVKELFDKFQQQLKDILSGGLSGGKDGKAGGALSRIGVKFAEGGQAFKVPNGFPGDSFPANLTSGELVVDRSTASKLRDFLDGRESLTPQATSREIDVDALVGRLAAIIEGRPINVSLTLNEQQLATAVYNAGRRGFRI